MTEPTKRCSHCGEVKPVSEFYRNSSSKDGYRFDCKACSDARYAEYGRKHRAEITRKKRERLAANPEARERQREYERAYHRRRRAQKGATSRIPTPETLTRPNPNAEMCARLDAAIRARQGADV